MAEEMSRGAKIKLWTEFLEWLEKGSSTLERKHISDLLRWDILHFQDRRETDLKELHAKCERLRKERE